MLEAAPNFDVKKKLKLVGESEPFSLSGVLRSESSLSQGLTRSSETPPSSRTCSVRIWRWPIPVMFSTSCTFGAEVNKYMHAKIQTVSGIRGEIKKAPSPACHFVFAAFVQDLGSCSGPVALQTKAGAKKKKRVCRAGKPHISWRQRQLGVI